LAVAVSNLWCRKALSTNSALSSVQRLAVSNLWCRKALSTDSQKPRLIVATMCRISDAERRWALKRFSNCWRCCWVSNLWCRKALSTCCFFNAKHSLIVSNLWCRKALSTCCYQKLWAVCLRCRISDAERRWALAWYSSDPGRTGSVESLMPKGVEHFGMNHVQLLKLQVSNLWCRKALSTSYPSLTRL